jgi:hypothetical protein
MKSLVNHREKALVQYKDLRDTIAVIEAMNVQGDVQGKSWDSLKKKLHARNN